MKTTKKESGFKRDVSFADKIPAHDLFLARCVDSKVLPNPERERRFVGSLARNCSEYVLDLREQGFRANAAEALSRFLSLDSNFATVVLGNNELGDEGAKAAVKCLKQNQSITRLDFRSTGITPRGARAIFEALEVNRSVTWLDLSTAFGVNRNIIGPSGADALATVLRKNEVFTCLVMRDVSLGIPGAAKLAPGLTASLSLVKLDLSLNGLGPEGCSSVCQALAAASPGSRLEYLSLSNNGIGDAGAAAVGEMLKLHSSLETLDLSKNGIGPDGAAAISKGLKANKVVPLATLVLEENKCGDKGTEELCSWLVHNKTLTELVLAKNGLAGGSGGSIAAALRGNHTLRKLDLHHNQLGAGGVGPICETLTFSHHLRNLDLATNKIGPPGTPAIVSLIRENRSLQHLSIRDNGLDAASGTAIALCIGKNDFLLTFNTDMNEVAYADHSLIGDMVRRNRQVWERAAPTREAEELGKLREKQEELQAMERELHQAALEAEKKQEGVLAAEHSLEEERDLAAGDVSHMQAEIQSKAQQLRDAAESGSGAADMAAVKEAKEIERKAIVGQINQERGLVRKLTVMLERVGEELRTTLEKYETETKVLEKKLSFAMFDLQSSTQDVTSLQKRVQQGRQLVQQLEEQAVLAATDSANRQVKGGGGGRKKTGARQMSPMPPVLRTEPAAESTRPRSNSMREISSRERATLISQAEAARELMSSSISTRMFIMPECPRAPSRLSKLAPLRLVSSSTDLVESTSKPGESVTTTVRVLV